MNDAIMSSPPNQIDLSRIDFFPKDKEYKDVTLDEAIEIFHKTVKTRDVMGGDLYYSILNDQVDMMYDICVHKGLVGGYRETLFYKLR